MADSWNNLATKLPGLLVTSDEFNKNMANVRLLKGGAGDAAPVSSISSLQTQINNLGSSSAKNDNYILLDADTFDVIRMTTGSSTDKTLTLPTAADNTDREVTLIKADSGSNYAILSGEGGETIDYLGIQQTTITVELQGRGLTVKSNGTSWDVINVLGAEIISVGGTLELLYEKFLQGTTAAGATTSVAHGVDYDKVTWAGAFISEGTNYRIYDNELGSVATRGYRFYFTSANATLAEVGSTLQSQAYRISFKYYI
jgi:hypothetical protein